MHLRLLCRFWGCCLDEYVNCARCGANLYEPNARGQWFIETGWYDGRVFGWWHRIRAWSMPRCMHCRRPLLFRRRCGFDGNFCSDACSDLWIPF